MKKYLVLLASLLIAVSTQSQNQFTINGQVADIADDTQIKLARINPDNTESEISATTIIKGRFVLDGTTDRVSEKVYLTLFKNDRPYFTREIWIGRGLSTTIVGKNKHVMLWDVQNATKEQQELNKYIAACYDELFLQSQQGEVISGLFEKMRDPNASSDETARVKTSFDSIRNISMPIIQRIVEKEIEVMQNSEISDVWMEKLDGYVETFFVANQNDAFRNIIFELYGKLPEDMKNTEKGRSITTKLFPHTTIGAEAVDAELADLEGNTHQLAEYRGKYVLVDFWASWCGPCLMALPELRRIYFEYDDRVTVVGVNLDKDFELWETASYKHRIEWVNLWEKKGFTQGLHAAYGGTGIPHYVLISPEGIVLDVWTGYVEGGLKEKINTYLNK